MDKQRLINYYANHSDKDTANYFQITKEELINYLTHNEIPQHTKGENISLTLLNRTSEQKQQAELKRRKTNQEKYGCDNVSQNKEIAEKISHTLQNFSSEQRQHRLDSMRNTISNRTDEYQQLITQHKSEATKRYFENLTEEQRIKFSQTMSEAYQNMPDENKIARAEKIQDTYRQTCMDKYNLSNALMLEDVKDKIRNTNLERYGVPYYCMTEKCRQAIGGNSANSKPNQDIARLLDERQIKYSQEYNIETYSFDFRIDNILLEIDPWITHNSTVSPFGNPKESFYHYDKSEVAREHGFRCIHIFDWDNVDKILNSISTVAKTVYARSCEIKEIDNITTNNFIVKYHFQNNVKSQVQIGLFYDGDLISVMTFGKPRYNKKYEYELLRLCTAYDYKIIGGSERMFKYFIRTYNPKSIISYCDLSKFNGDVYNHLGFVYSTTTIGKHWYNPKSKKHITDNLLRQRGVDQLLNKNYGKDTNNETLMLQEGFVEIFDAGQSTYKWRNV